jgi:hypothetical protein
MMPTLNTPPTCGRQHSFITHSDTDCHSRPSPSCAPAAIHPPPPSPWPRILLCDDDSSRLQKIAHELMFFPTRSAIEIVSPRSKFISAAFSSDSHPQFPVMIFFINVGCIGVGEGEEVVPSSVYGTLQSQGRRPDPSSFQIFQVCHVSRDHVVSTDSLNALR